jgi:hypothetical protein
LKIILGLKYAILTPWRSVLLEKLLVQPVKNIPFNLWNLGSLPCLLQATTVTSN